MEIVRNESTKTEMKSLWKDFLLAGVVNDLMMGEIKNHLYIDHMDTAWLRGKTAREKERALVGAVVDTGFGDTVDASLAELYQDPGAFWPCSELCSMENSDALYGQVMGAIRDHTAFYRKEAVMRNPYYRKVRVRKARSGPVSLGLASYLPYEFFETFHEKDEANPFFFAEAGFFDRKISFPVVRENGKVWMSIVLSEIESMRKPVQEARGRVITYGLGLGYYAFMCSEKEEVDSVDAVELNPHMTELFKKHLLPQFPHKEKIHVIQGDAMDFVKKQEDGAYDYAFSDFWAGFYDGLLLYLKFLPLTLRFRETKHSFWIEKSFIDYFMRPVLMQFLMDRVFQVSFSLGEERSDVLSVLKGFYSFLEMRKGRIAAGSEIRTLLSGASIKKLLMEWVSL